LKSLDYWSNSQLIECGKSITNIFLSIFGKNEPFGVMDIFLAVLEM